MVNMINIIPANYMYFSIAGADVSIVPFGLLYLAQMTGEPLSFSSTVFTNYPLVQMTPTVAFFFLSDPFLSTISTHAFSCLIKS